MDIKAFFEEKIKKATEEQKQRRFRVETRVAQYEAEREFVEKSNLFPETTDTLNKLKNANGKRVLLHSPDGWTEIGTLEFTGTRINTSGVSYPIIGDSDSGLVKITTVEENEVVFENPYKDQSTIYQAAMLLGRQAGLEEAEAKIASERHSLEYWEEGLQALIDAEAKVPEYVEMGSKLIYPQQKEKWEECVCYRMADLYRGAELKNALEIMEALDKGVTVEEAGKLISDGHSGMSYGITMSIVLEFSKRGVEFCKANHSSYKYALERNDAEDIQKWENRFKDVETQNKAFAEAEKAADGKDSK